jgi:hypothetical protein
MRSVLSLVPRRLAAVSCCAMAALAPPALAGISWLPAPSPISRSLADPREPRFSVFFGGHPERVEVAVGTPFPLVAFAAAGSRLVVVLEGGAYLTLGRENGTFPLETVDGLFGLSVEGTRDRVMTRLRLVHMSAHKADGDSTVAFPASTYSKEFAMLDVGLRLGRAMIYGRVAGAWHAVPSDRGPHIGAGGQWRGAGRLRPIASGHLEAERDRSWRFAKSLFVGAETGRGPTVRLGLRAFSGPSPRGQYWRETERFAGLELQLVPGSP